MAEFQIEELLEPEEDPGASHARPDDSGLVNSLCLVFRQGSTAAHNPGGLPTLTPLPPSTTVDIPDVEETVMRRDIPRPPKAPDADKIYKEAKRPRRRR